jgi:predicted lipid-binding transport protein (Tim44 family)
LKFMFLIISILISILLFYKLFKEFGRTREVFINLSDVDKEKIKKAIEQIVPVNAQESLENQNIDSEQLKNVEMLQEKFPDFSLQSFLIKAEEMFDAIFNGLANSHHHILKTMLTNDLYEEFAKQIQKREERNLRQELLIKHKQTKLEKIQLLAEKVRIFISFEISQMSAMVNIDGVSFDNPKRLYRDVIHKWIFERDYTSDNWIVSKTSASEV